jgi:hypothetical protein
MVVCCICCLDFGMLFQVVEMLHFKVEMPAFEVAFTAA